MRHDVPEDQCPPRHMEPERGHAPHAVPCSSCTPILRYTHTLIGCPAGTIKLGLSARICESFHVLIPPV